MTPADPMFSQLTTPTVRVMCCKREPGLSGSGASTQLQSTHTVVQSNPISACTRPFVSQSFISASGIPLNRTWDISLRPSASNKASQHYGGTWPSRCLGSGGHGLELSFNDRNALVVQVARKGEDRTHSLAGDLVGKW
jgi:hypothetical protein